MEMNQTAAVEVAADALNSNKYETIDRHGKCRVVIDGVRPEVNAGRYPIKRVPGERVKVEAEIFADGHDLLTAILKYRHESESVWSEVPMSLNREDIWVGEFTVHQLGTYRYTVEGWMDPYKSWRSDLLKRVEAKQDISVDLVIGAQLVQTAARRADAENGSRLQSWAREFSTGHKDTLEARTWQALDEGMAALTLKYPDRSYGAVYPLELRVAVDPALARTGAWYEIFPRSCPGKAGPHGTFKDVENFLPRVAEMGFDVLYLPPIHPVGQAFRKGKNNNPTCDAGEPGSPWGIGAAEGGHKAILAELGNLEDFQSLVAKARDLKIEIALDIAFQCSPNHPWVREHPSWFKKRPDGTIQYAENPPKKYQDIYPINFETDDWPALWWELKSVIDYWIEQGVRVFRVDNPHTKSTLFWEWALGEIRRARPDTIFLAEAFTRPMVLYGLSKIGFNQSYNYFPWRNSKAELTEFITELSQPPVIEYFRANLWPNTPDILPHYLQHGGRPAFMIRLILAATIGGSYGIYGPAFELLEHRPFKEGSEEYLNSEKYEIRDWNLDQPGNLTELISRLNLLRRENPALHDLRGIHFHHTDNDTLIAYSKVSDDRSNALLMVVNLDPYNVQSGWINVALDQLGIAWDSSYEVHDLLTDGRYQWHGSWNYIQLRPWEMPAHLFRVRQL